MRPLLFKKVIVSLSKTFFVTDFLDNALAISFSEKDLPFALIIVEDDDPNTLYYSVAVNAPDPFSIADIVLRLIHVAKTELSEPFFLDDSGELHWGQEAYETYMIERPEDINSEFMSLESPSKLIN